MGFASSFGNSSSDQNSGSFGRSDSNSASGYSWTPWQMNAMNSIWPQLQGAANIHPGTGLAGQNLTVGGATAYPTITTAPIWDQGQIQNQVNLNRANNDASAASQVNQMRRETAGRGYGAYSPFAETTAQNIQGMNRAGNTETETNLRFNAAQQNAAQILKEQMADVQRTGMFNNDLFQRDQLRVDQDLKRKGLGLQQYGIDWGAKMNALGQAGQLFQPHPWSKSNSNSMNSSWSNARNDSNQGSYKQDTGPVY